MATVPSIFQGLTPTFTGTGLSPLQLALASYMAQGTPIAFGVNQNFLRAMQIFSSSAPLTPLDFDVRTGLPRVPDIQTNIIGINYVVVGDDVYLIRRALDCGPDENRTELVLIGKQTEVATGTWTYYGPFIASGTVSDGSSDPSNGPESIIDVPNPSCSNTVGAMCVVSVNDISAFAEIANTTTTDQLSDAALAAAIAAAEQGGSIQDGVVPQ